MNDFNIKPLADLLDKDLEGDKVLPAQLSPRYDVVIRQWEAKAYTPEGKVIENPTQEHYFPLGHKTGETIVLPFKKESWFARFKWYRNWQARKRLKLIRTRNYE